MPWPMDSSMMGLMIVVCIAVVAALLYFAYRYGRMVQRLADRETNAR